MKRYGCGCDCVALRGSIHLRLLLELKVLNFFSKLGAGLAPVYLDMC